MDDKDFNDILNKDLSDNNHKLSDYTLLPNHAGLKGDVAQIQSAMEKQIMMINNNTDQVVGGAQNYLQGQINDLKYHKANDTDLSWTQNNINKIQAGLQGEIVNNQTDIQKSLYNSQQYLQGQINTRCTWDSMNWMRETFVPNIQQGLQNQINNKCDWSSVNWIRQTFVPNIQNALQDQINSKCDWQTTNNMKADYTAKFESLQEQVNGLRDDISKLNIDD